MSGRLDPPTRVTVTGPAGWTIVPNAFMVAPGSTRVPVTLHAPTNVDDWPMRNLFVVRLESAPPVESTFGVAGSGLWRFLGVYFDALPDPEDELQLRRRFVQHFVSLRHDYLPESAIDIEKEYQHWSHALGRPAMVYSRENEIDLAQVVGLRGAYCAYLSRTVVAPATQPAYLVIGNNDAYRLYLNGELVHETEECTWWTPFNNAHPVTLHQGPNHLLVKLLKRSDDLRFTLGIRANTANHGGQNNEDWIVDLSDDSSFLA